MIQHDDKQEIAQLLSKFMAGETSVAEEEVLAQYFRTHEVDEEWAEYKEMFTLFDNGQVDIEIEERAYIVCSGVTSVSALLSRARHELHNKQKRMNRQ